jgi:hypothetical protein
VLLLLAGAAALSWGAAAAIPHEGFHPLAEASSQRLIAGGRGQRLRLALVIARWRVRARAAGCCRVWKL